MPDNIFNTWKEIAHYVGQNIRTCQRWEKDLGFPVHRLDNYQNSRVFAYKEEIDNWLKDKLNIQGINRKHQISFTLKQSRLIIISIIIIFAATAILASILLNSSSPPVDFKISNSKLIVLNEQREKLWEYDTGIDDLESESLYKTSFQKKKFHEGAYFLPLIAFEDIDKNGSKETLFIVQPTINALEKKLICFSEEGIPLWHFKPSEYREKECANLHSKIGFGLEDIDDDGSYEIILLDSPILDCPSHVVLLDHKGVIIAHYKHAGHIRDYVCFDMNHDGIKEIILAGDSTEWQSQACAVLDFSDMKEIAHKNDRNFISEIDSLWCLKYLIVFPTNILNELNNENIAIRQIEIVDDNSAVLIRFKSLVEFDSNLWMELVNIEFSLRYKQDFRKYERNGKIRKSLQQVKKQMFLEGPSYFTGKYWTKTPTPLTSWQEQNDTSYP